MEEVVVRINKHFKKDCTSRFDIDLNFGESSEYALGQILNMGKVEVKTERNKWKKTGNIAIELSSRGKYSGLVTTEADWWAHILSFNNNIESVILIPVDKLKKEVKKLVKEKKARIVMGGDNFTSELVLVPIKHIHGIF